MKFNHLTLETGNNRISDSSEIDPQLFETFMGYLASKKTRLYDDQDYFIELENDHTFYLAHRNTKIIKSRLLFVDDDDYKNISEEYGIQNQLPILAVELTIKLLELKDLSFLGWAGDFERCIAHTILLKK